MKEARKTSDDEAPDLGALAAWAPELARTFVSLSSDIALVIDGTGVIRNVAQPPGEPLAPVAHQWVGRQWIDTVSGDTRQKIENLLKEVVSHGVARRREVNHPLQPGVSIPVAYTAIRLGVGGPVLAVGRDLRAIAAIQQRFIDSQQDMERGYWRVRQAESRYRLLFQVATDAVMVVDAESLNIVEANQACAQMFDIAVEHLPGRPATFGFDQHARSAIVELLNSARSSGQTGEIRARLSGTIKTTSVAATSFRADDTMRLLVRVRAVDTASADSAFATSLARLVDDARDAVVVTDSSGRILVANPAFTGQLNLASETDVKGHQLLDWLGTPDRPLSALLNQVRRKGITRKIESWLKPRGQAAMDVEVSAALLTEGDQECIGFTIHRPAKPARAPHYDALVTTLRQGMEKLDTQLGSVGLTDLVQRAAMMTEAHLLSVALLRAHGNSTDAAQSLGIDPADFEKRQAYLSWSLQTGTDSGTGE